MTIRYFASAIGMHDELDAIVDRLRPSERTRGRPRARVLEFRVCIVCFAQRASLSFRELAAVFAISRSQAHRIVADLVPRLAALLVVDLDRRRGWIVDGTLVPTHDHAVAATSKNDRWSCNLQVLARRDLRILAISGAALGLEMIRSTMLAPRSKRSVVITDASWPTADIVANGISWSRGFVADGSFVIADGGAIANVASASSTPLQGSRAGVCCAIIAVAGGISLAPLEPSLSSTTSAQSFETVLSPGACAA